MRSFNLKILEADSTFYEGECESLTVPAIDGDYGVYAGHENAVTALKEGMLIYKIPGQGKKIAAITPGVMKIENNEVLVLAAAIEDPNDIDIERARQDALEAEEAMRREISQAEYFQSKAIIARNANRIRVKGKIDTFK